MKKLVTPAMKEVQQLRIRSEKKSERSLVGRSAQKNQSNVIFGATQDYDKNERIGIGITRKKISLNNNIS